MIYVGVDIGKARHCAAAIDEHGSKVLDSMVIEQTVEGFDALDQKLQTLGKNTELKVGLEASGHYWKILWQFLTEKSWKVEVMNPILSAASARTNLRGRKTDADDALVIAKTLRDGGFTPMVMGSSQIEELKTLCRQRRWIICELANAKRRLTGLLDQVFPEFCSQFSESHCKAALAVLKEAPSAQLVSPMHLTRLTHLLKETSRGRFSAAKAEALRQAARTSVAVAYQNKAAESCIQIMIKQLEFFEDQIQELDRQIAAIFEPMNHPIKTITGIGKVAAPIILSELGEISRFGTCRASHKVLAYAGMDPRIRESGQWTGKVKMSKRGSPTLRTALFQAASMARIHCPVFGAIYKRHKEQNKKHHAVAISHVARKLVEVICAVCNSKQPFDPKKLCPATP